MPPRAAALCRRGTTRLSSFLLLSMRPPALQHIGDRIDTVSCGTDVKAIPIVVLNGDHFVVGACGSDMKVIPFCSLNGGRPVVGACMSDTKAIPSCLLNGDRLVVDACGSDITHRNLLIDDRIGTERNQLIDACGSDMNVIPTALPRSLNVSDMNASSCLLNGDRAVVNACRSDVVGACVSDMNAIPSCLLNGDRVVVDACRSNMKTVPTDLRILKSVLERRRLLADRFNWAAHSLTILHAECAPLRLLDTPELNLSSCFSGSGTPEVCMEALVNVTLET